MCACLCPYSIPLFKYPHFRIVFLGPSMTLLFRDRPKSHFGLSETQVAPEISWLISFSLWGPQASHFAVRHLITCTCFDPEPQRIPAQSAVNGLNILRQERCRRLNMAIKNPLTTAVCTTCYPEISEKCIWQHGYSLLPPNLLRHLIFSSGSHENVAKMQQNGDSLAYHSLTLVIVQKPDKMVTNVRTIFW